MKIGQPVKIGILILISFNILMAFSSIWIFTRMSPAIEEIISRNQVSLKACEDMLSAMTLLSKDKALNLQLKKKFTIALNNARNNITETAEPEALQNIQTNYLKALENDFIHKEKTVSAISKLAQVNRQAMIKADLKAKKLGYAGAWTIVFMSATIFFTGMLVKRSLNFNLIQPLNEIYSVFKDSSSGNKLRRCSGNNLPEDIKLIYNKINEYLDKK